jgi:transcriptional regulator with GAF, ATPase, and Fis domain
MTQDKQATELLDVLNKTASDGEQLSLVLNRLFQTLTKHGIQISFDINGMVRNVNQGVRDAQKRSRQLIDKLEQSQELVQTFALITSSLELDQVLEEVMDTVIKLTRAERAYLMLKEKGDELKIRAARNWDRETLGEDDAFFSRTVVNTALSEGEAIITTNAQTDDRFQGMQSVVSHGLRSIICIPLVLGGKVVGALYADNRIEQGLFSQDSVPLLTAFGTQAAIAINNARTFGRVKDDLDRAQRELKRLQIQIDQSKVQEQVSEITETDYFQKLQSAARSMRKQFSADDDQE